ncbi:hypothetical protein OIU76_010493 [Salix suchowensis]|nr:hypothetical protein OIU76_010493 [Salix suchowensis]
MAKLMASLIKVRRRRRRRRRRTKLERKIKQESPKHHILSGMNGFRGMRLRKLHRRFPDAAKVLELVYLAALSGF